MYRRRNYLKNLVSFTVLKANEDIAKMRHSDFRRLQLIKHYEVRTKHVHPYTRRERSKHVAFSGYRGNSFYMQSGAFDDVQRHVAAGDVLRR